MKGNVIEVPLYVDQDEYGDEVYVGRGSEKVTVDLSRVSFRVLHPLEGSNEATLLIKRSPKKKYPPPTEEDFLDEIQRAEDHFANVEGGYVGYGYFIHHWHAKNIPFGLRVRGPMLEKLAEQGKVILYDAPDGKKAIRLP